ncbi:MAG: M50 family metallopeptidase [Candidatus Omnitrophica bacterium]|nr:M50 family metallopeptidase [Candidatus Omnitrophota bacterium]
MNRRGAPNDWIDHPAFAKERRGEAIRSLLKPFKRESLILQLTLFVIVLLLWRIPIFNPIKLVVVLFHELSHVLAAFLTGGAVFGIAIHPGGAGVTLGMGGNELAIVSAGYVGSLFLGVLLYLLSTSDRSTEVWGFLTMVCCLSLAFGWLNSFTAFFGYGTISLLLLGLFKLDDPQQQFFIRWIATTSCLYPVLDVAGEALGERADGFSVGGRVVGSDVSQLAQMTGISPILLSLGWGIAGLALLVLLVTWSAKRDAQRRLKERRGDHSALAPLTYTEKGDRGSDRFPEYEIY